MSTPALGSEKAEMGQGGGAESWGTQRGRAQMGEQLGESRRERLMTRKGRKGWRVRSWVRPHSARYCKGPPGDSFASSLGSLLPFPSSSGLSGGQGLFIVPPHLWSQSPLNIEHQLAAFSELQRKRHNPPAQSSQPNGGGCAQNPHH